MRKVIIGVILSLLIIMIMIMSASAASAARPTPPIPTPNPLETRVADLEANDTVQQVNNTEQANLIEQLHQQILSIVEGLQGRLSVLDQRTTKLENNDSTRGMYSTIASNIRIEKDLHITNIASYDVNLNQPSFVYVEGSGMSQNCNPENGNCNYTGRWNTNRQQSYF